MQRSLNLPDRRPATWRTLQALDASIELSSNHKLVLQKVFALGGGVARGGAVGDGCRLPAADLGLRTGLLASRVEKIRTELVRLGVLHRSSRAIGKCASWWVTVPVGLVPPETGNLADLVLVYRERLDAWLASRRIDTGLLRLRTTTGGGHVSPVAVVQVGGKEIGGTPPPTPAGGDFPKTAADVVLKTETGERGVEVGPNGRLRSKKQRPGP